MRISGMALLLWMLMVVIPTYAQEVPVDVIQAIERIIPGAQPDSIERSPIADMYTVAFGPHIVYVSADGKYFFRGDVLEIDSGRNLTEEKRQRARAASIEKLGEETMIVFAPEKTEYTITVFTDVDCGYCVKLHNDMATLNDYGIKVRYLAFPRGGLASQTYEKMVSVWCADDPRDSMTRAKRREQIELKKCTNPIKDHYAMGQLVGVNGTPTLVFENGQVYPGYAPPERLIEALRDGSG